MGTPIEITVTVAENTNRRHVEKELRGLLVLQEYDAYVDTVNLPDDEIEITIDVSSPQDAQHVKQKIRNVNGVSYP